MLRPVHEDERFIAIYKPAGLLVHRTGIDAADQRSAVQMVRQQWAPDASPVHRLDKPTCGVLLFAKDAEALRWAQAEWGEQRVQKRYLAVVRGWMEGAGLIDYALRPEAEFRGRQRERPAQEAQTRYEVLQRVELPLAVGRYATARFSLVRLSPLTGRTHQLRRHMAHLRHPIVGDTRHGDGAQNRFAREQLNAVRLFLIADGLSFERGFAGTEPMRLEATPDTELAAALERCGFAVDEMSC